MKLQRLIPVSLALAVLLLGAPAEKANAACSTQSVVFSGTHILYTNDCENDDEELIVTGDVSRYRECFIMSTTGAVDILVSIDGTNYATAPLSIQDFGATSTAPVVVTVANRIYGFRVLFRRIKVVQNGATDAAASLICGT